MEYDADERADSIVISNLSCSQFIIQCNKQLQVYNILNVITWPKVMTIITMTITKTQN